MKSTTATTTTAATSARRLARDIRCYLRCLLACGLGSEREQRRTAGGAHERRAGAGCASSVGDRDRARGAWPQCPPGTARGAELGGGGGAAHRQADREPDGG